MKSRTGYDVKGYFVAGLLRLLRLADVHKLIPALLQHLAAAHDRVCGVLRQDFQRVRGVDVEKLVFCILPLPRLCVAEERRYFTPSPVLSVAEPEEALPLC